MAFRIEAEKESGYERAKKILLSKSIPQEARKKSADVLDDIVLKYGPVVQSYPTWHPFVSHADSRKPFTIPGQDLGYKGLDHTIFLVNGIITCPYGDGQDIIESVQSLPEHPVADITCEKLKIKLYNPDATPILIKCTWKKGLGRDGTIPKSISVPLMMEKELPCWRWSEVGETWDTMCPYILGMPHGKRSSLFVNQETALVLKHIFTSMVETGMYGPIKVD